MAAARKQTTTTAPGMDALVMNDTQPISMFKTEGRRVRKPKAEIVEEQAAPVEQPVVEEPKTRQCPGHSELWPEEAEARPMAEYHYNKTTGKLASGYCHKCNIKPHSMYAKEKRAEQRGPSINDQLNETLMRMDDLTAQVTELETLNTALQEQIEALTAVQQQTA